MYPSSGVGERSPAYAYSAVNDTRITDGGRSRRWLYVVAGFGVLGAFFSGLSTSDFVAHLDRQVHSIHCSILPGAAAQFGESGCRTVMMSPYSSLFRESIWGGLPISLLALAVFFYMAARALSFALKGDLTRRETGYMLLGTMLPLGMSLVYGYLSMRELGAVCKLCVGVYVSSGGLVVAALLAHLAAPSSQGDPVLAAWGVWFLIGVGYVGVLAGLYVGLVPEPTASQTGCGTLLTREDPAEVLLEIGGQRGGVSALAVLDPLCPACKGFDARLEASGLTTELSLDAVLFPLDSTCNWMVKDSLHPGACAVSEAMLCLPKEAPAILAAAFREQEKWLNLAREDETKLRRLLEQRYPKVKGCLGSAKAKNRVNKSLRFAVANALPVLTPQLFIGDKRLCEEDTDLGLEYTVRRMIDEVRR